MRTSPLLLLGLAAVPLALFGFQRQLSPVTQVKQLRAVLGVKSLALALNAYAADADDTYPNVQNLNSLKVVTLPYVKDKTLWKTDNPKSEIRFNNAVGGVVRSSIAEPKDTVIFYESKPWPDNSRAVSFVDGNGRLLTAHDWARSAMTLILHDVKKTAEPLPASLGKSWKD
jgi:hypothetical protein